MKSLRKNVFSLMFALCGVFALLCSASCRSANPADDGDNAPVLSEHNEDTRNAGMAMAEKYMTSFIAAVQQDDFNILSEILPENSSKRVDRAKFADMQKWISSWLGRLESGKYIDRFSQGALCIYIWKLTFVKEQTEKEAQDGAGEPEKSVIEIPYSVNVMMINGEPKIVKAGFAFR